MTQEANLGRDCTREIVLSAIDDEENSVRREKDRQSQIKILSVQLRYDSLGYQYVPFLVPYHAAKIVHSTM